MIEVMRVWLVVAKKFPATEFRADNANLSPFLQRLTRAHANCVEGFPIFGGLLIIALITDQTWITDPLSSLFLAARIGQSLAHLISLSIVAVNFRFMFFTVQLAIGLYWAAKLLLVFWQ
ncbi:MAG: MAPEG family protein [Chromatiales bacterium RIFOXYA1_FULL_46_5]|nr:MAG: MAPEG family protein [Chromatiales bacterium RIFOXYA1_FULL_46_5]